MPLLYPSQNIKRYISTARWPQGLEPAFITNVNTVWPLQPVYPDRKNPVVATNINYLSVCKMEEHRYLHQLRTRVDQALPDAEDMETLEPWARLPAEGFQFHQKTRMDIWPSDSYNLATRVLATASIFATLALSSYKGVFSVSVTEYRNPLSPPTNDDNRALISAYEALGPNGSMALLYKDFLPEDGSEGNFQRRVLTYFWFDRSVFTAEVLDAFTATTRAPRDGPLKLTGMLRDWIWSRCNMNDTQFWCLGTGEQMLYGWCDWNSNTIYTTKRFSCDEPAPTLLEMTLYWIVEAFTEHPDLADWHEFSGPTGVKAKCKQVSQIAGWMPTIAMNGQVVTGHPAGMPHIVINASGGAGGMSMGGTAIGTGGTATGLGGTGLGGTGLGGTGLGGTGLGGTGLGGSNTSTGITNTNNATSTSTSTAHSHIPVTNTSKSNAIASSSPKSTLPTAGRKRRLEDEEEEADSDKHRTQRRKFTHSYEAASDGYSSGYESSHPGHHSTIRPMQKDIHRDLRHAVSQVAVSGGHRPTSRPASKSASKAASKATSRRSKRSKRRMTTTRSASEESYCDCGHPDCENPFFIPMTFGGPQDGPKRAFDASESSSDSGRTSPRAYMEKYVLEQQRLEAEAARQAAAEAEHSTRTQHSHTPSTTIVESFEEIADIPWEWADDPNLSDEQRQALSTVLHEPETFDLMLKYFRAENVRLSMQRPLANSLIVAAQKDPSKTRDILKSGIIPEEDRYLLPALPPQPEVAAATGPGGVGASGDFRRVPHQHQRTRGHSTGPSMVGSVHSSRISRLSRPSGPSSVVRIRQFPSKLPHHGMKATTMKSSLKSSLKSAGTSKSQAMSIDSQSVRSRKKVSFASKLTRTRRWRPEVSSSGSSAKTKKCSRRRKKGKAKAIGPPVAPTPDIDDPLEMELPSKDESDQMRIVPIASTSMNLDTKTGSDTSTPPAPDLRLSRSSNEEARVWSAPPKSAYSSKSIKSVESTLQKTKHMDVDAFMSHGNDERKKKHAEVEKLKDLRRHLDQMALKRGKPAQAIPARAADGRPLDYCGSFQFLQAPEQAAARATSTNAASSMPFSLAPKFVDKSEVYDYSHAQFAPTPRSIPDDDMPSSQPASPDQNALNQQWEKQKEEVKMDVERSRDSVREQLLSRKGPTRGKTPRTTLPLNPAQQFPTMTSTKASAAGSFANTHLAPPFPGPQAVFAPSPASNPSPSSASHEGQIEIKVSPGFDPSSIFSPGTSDAVAMLNATSDAVSPARSAPTPATPAELEAPITPDPQSADVLMDGAIVDQAQIAHPLDGLFPQSFLSLGPVQPHWDPSILQPDPSMGLQAQAQQWNDLWGSSEEVAALDTIIPTADPPLHLFLASSTPSPANWATTGYSNSMLMQQASLSQRSLNAPTSSSPLAAPYFMSPPDQASTPLTQNLFMDQSIGRAWSQGSLPPFGTFDQALERRQSGPLWTMDRVPSPSRTDYSDSSHQPTDPTPNQSWDSVDDSLMLESYGNFNSYLQQGQGSAFSNTNPFNST